MAEEVKRDALGDLLEQYTLFLKLERALSPNTCAAYKRDGARFLDYCREKGKTPQTADRRFIDDFLTLLQDDGLCARSLFRKMESLKSFYRFLAIEGMLAENPVRHLHAPHMPQRFPEALSTADMDKLLTFPARTFAESRTVAIVTLFYASGLRISELLALRMESLNTEQGWVLVQGKGGKERVVPVHKQACQTVLSYLRLRFEVFAGKDTAEQLFVNRTGGKLSRVQVWKDIRKLGIAANVHKPLHPHLFRHTFASHLLRGGADLRSLQEMLGHASLANTQIYTHLDRSDIKDIHSKHHPRG